MGPCKPKKRNRVRDTKRACKTKARTKDIDQIHSDLQDPCPSKFTSELDPDLPGLGQFYCIECARYFTNQVSLDDHIKTKLHKKRVKELKSTPYTQQEADAAAGLGVDNGKGRTLNSTEFYQSSNSSLMVN